MFRYFFSFFFFFNDTATTEIYTLSLHDALPISANPLRIEPWWGSRSPRLWLARDRKSTRLNSSHDQDLVCRLLLEKKKQNEPQQQSTTTQNKHNANTQ